MNTFAFVVWSRTEVGRLTTRSSVLPLFSHPAFELLDGDSME